MFNSKTKVVMIVATLFLSLVMQSSAAQRYPHGRVVLKNGIVVKGTSMVVADDNISLKVNYQESNYAITDIALAESKRGWAGGWAIGCGFGCFGVLLVSNLTNPENPLTDGQIVIGSLLWGGVSAGAGALVGMLTDQYKPVYVGTSTSLLDNIDFNVVYLQDETIGANLTLNIPSRR